MPIVPGTPFDSVQSVLQQAIVKCNDAASGFGIQGDILNASQPGTIPLINGRYRYLQDRLQAAGVETFSKYEHIYGITPAATSSASTQLTIDYQGYWDGQTKNAAIKLPSDMIKPLELWERESGTDLWVPMKQAADSISTRPQTMRFSIWDFEADTLYLPPATTTNDIKMKNIVYAPDITTMQSQILIIRSQEAMACLIAAEAAASRGSLEMGAYFSEKAEEAIQAIIARTARKESYAAYNRLPFRRRSGRGGRGGY